nr:Nif3-like dinuclear metal center hexameric protein [Saprospiraceae bacterium]
MNRIRDIQNALEGVAPTGYQENYDNSGLIIGDSETPVEGVLVSLDVTEEVVDEAITLGCNLIVAHHPLIFKGLKKINSSHWIGRCVQKAIKNDLAIYAIHTNLDNVLDNGVNGKIADRLQLVNRRVLSPKEGLVQFRLLVSPLLKKEAVSAIQSVSPQSFSIHKSVGSGESEKGESPFYSCTGLIRAHSENFLQSALAPFSLKADFQNSRATDPGLGAGMVGDLELPVTEKEFLSLLKKQLNTGLIRHTQLLGKSVSRVAVCGGAGSFLLGAAVASGADFFVTGDFKYHDFFEADKRIVVADVGHFESEQYTIELIFDILKDNFSTFALHCTKVNTNPINYY